MTLTYRSPSTVRTVPGARPAHRTGAPRTDRDHPRAPQRPRAVVLIGDGDLRRDIVEQLAGAGFAVEPTPAPDGATTVAPRVAVVDLDALDPAGRDRLRRLTGPATARVLITGDRTEALRRRTDRDEPLLAPVTGVQVAAAALRVGGAPYDVLLRWTTAVFDRALRAADPEGRFWG